MRVLLQRVSRASVTVSEEIVGAIDAGLLLFVGFTDGDSQKEIQYFAEKVVNLRIFEDHDGKMNRSLLDVKGSILSVSQFTLYGDCRKGRRPNFMAAARPDEASALYDQWNKALTMKGIRVKTGVFGAMMDVELINDGPVTLFLDSLSNPVL
ncbi:D-aminoacyl-tRNA deacylase [Shimazuella kribbensis]|uniref:D-aminoacyl-tRNA deacylase n=1 Tax=Shimazuella kribbensis TaxID=139808 RepID=UPI00042857F9|nr:D-aminoacyl-tRNA deacylase [Shimazuella kribbensis]